MKIQATTVVTMNISEVHAVVAAHLLTLGYKVVGFENGEYEVEKVEVVVNMFKVDVEVEDDEEVFKAQEVFKAVDLFKVPDVITMSHSTFQSKDLVVQANHKFEDFSDSPFQESMQFGDEVISPEEFEEELSRVEGNHYRESARVDTALFAALKYYGQEGIALYQKRWFMSHEEFREACFRLWAKVKTKLAEEEAELRAAKASYREQYDRAQEYARKMQEDADARQSDRDGRVRNYHNSEALNAKAEVKRQKELLRKAREASKKKSEEIERLKAMVRDLKAKK